MKKKLFTIIGILLVAIGIFFLLWTKNTIGQDAIKSGVHVVSSDEYKAWYKALAWKNGQIAAPQFDEGNWKDCLGQQKESQCIQSGKEQIKITTNQLVSNLWYRQEAAQRSISAEEDEIQKAIEIFKLSKQSEGQLQSFLQQTGLTEQMIHSFVQDEVLATKVRRDEIQKLKTPTDTELKQEFKLYPTLFSKPETKQIKILAFDSLSKASMAKNELLSGLPWQRVQELYGKKESKINNSFQKSDMPTSLEKLVWDSPEKIIQGPKQAKKNLWIIFQVEKTVASQKFSFAKAKPWVFSYLQRKREDESIEILNRKLRNRWGIRTECEKALSTVLCKQK